MSNINEATNVIIKQVELFWVKLSKPVEPFGELQWEVQIRFPKKRVKEMEQFGKVKETDVNGVYSINLKKKALKKDGEPALPVKVVGKTAGEVVDPRTIGNGSIGNVKVMQRDYEIKGPKGNVTKSGTTTMLVAVQVTDLIKYVPKGNDFDFDDEESDDTTNDGNGGSPKKVPAAAKAKAAKGNQKGFEDADDDIPF